VSALLLIMSRSMMGMTWPLQQQQQQQGMSTAELCLLMMV
jgi:hypothetical protein